MAACYATNLSCLSPFEAQLATCANDNCCIEVSTGHNPGRDHDVLGTFLPESFRSGQSLTKDCKHVGSAFALSATAMKNRFPFKSFSRCAEKSKARRRWKRAETIFVGEVVSSGTFMFTARMFVAMFVCIM